ncbi:MAG TPA: response regulator [Candidatus Anoxymicrobiaceae bacterium]|jgi:DNA-binding response OmpR family regulator
MDNNEGMPLRAAVIDDDRDMVKVIRVMLKVKGIQTVEAFSGLSGYAMVKREQPDIVLLDIMMPDIDGFEVLRKLRLDKETERIPIIFVSARAGREHVERGLSLGAQGYMTKPFKPDDLIAKIVDVLDLAGDSA